MLETLTLTHLSLCHLSPPSDVLSVEGVASDGARVGSRVVGL